MTPEQQARDILERMGMEGAQNFSAGELVELANIISDANQWRKLPECKMQWISVKDRLPQDDDMVLVWNKDDVEFGMYDKTYGVWKDYTEYLRHITHWMPKPNGPE